MAYTEKDFNLSWGDITIERANTLVVTRPSALYSFSFRYDFQGVSAAVSSEELTVVSQNDTRVVYSWTPEESLSLAIPDSVSGSGMLAMTVAFNSSIPQLSNPNYCTKTYAFTAYVPDTMRPSATLTVALYVYASEQGKIDVAFAIALILLALTLIINLGANLAGKRLRRN